LQKDLSDPGFIERQLLIIHNFDKKGKKMSSEYVIFKERRKKLVEEIRKNNPEIKNGVIILFAGLENSKYRFRQNSSFYYLTGIEEPGVVFCSYFDGRDVLYTPLYGSSRAQWVQESICSMSDDSEKMKQNCLYMDISEIKYLGNTCSGYNLGKFFINKEYKALLEDLEEFVNSGGYICGFVSEQNSFYFSQVYRLQNILSEIIVDIKGDLKKCDISTIVHEMRQKKDKKEIGLIQKAVDITVTTHQYISRIINHGFFEHEIEGIISYSFLQHNATGMAFPSIVATGKNASILHYTGRGGKLKDGDLVVVDIGAEDKNYCADLTRTYPVSGAFTQRQKYLYQVVLDVQQYVESVVKPGMFLNNPDEQEKSLHHIALKQFEKEKLDSYFIHGIGHFLGLDVHDVGDIKKPLCEGDIFTIEPGVYISEESIGIRIEDDFMITKDGCICLSPKLCKRPDDIESLMRGK